MTVGGDWVGRLQRSQTTPTGWGEQTLCGPLSIVRSQLNYAPKIQEDLKGKREKPGRLAVSHSWTAAAKNSSLSSRLKAKLGATSTSLLPFSAKRLSRMSGDTM
mmetsp:Transcript_32455/g.69543  ORF Transcript_32455/g.69543 Transcript_32455/m.69543 type:complete len:104 (+) Transcript_32455:346-657(+)